MQLQERLAQLIATPSVSSTRADLDMPNRPVVDLLAQWLEDLGFAIDIQPVCERSGKANLIATLGSGPGGLVLSGHTDTVPFDDSGWDSDPMSLQERDGRFYGLGSTDMKGFFPVAIAAAERFRNTPLKQPLIILATADEESTMDGARALVAAGKPKARYAIIGEPTDLKPIRMHKGIMMHSVMVQGRSGHSSNPKLGNSALEAMYRVLGELMQFRRELQEKYQHSGFAVPEPTLNLGCIHGGDNPNRICGECEVQFDLRVLPGMDVATLSAALESRLTALAQSLSINIGLRALMTPVAPFEQGADSELVAIAESISGQSAEAVAFGTEAPLLQQLGMQTLVMGPGSIDLAHQPNEFLDSAQIDPAVDLLTGFIRRLCL